MINTSAYDGLSRRGRRRLLVRALVRPLLSAALWVVLYFTLPLDRAFSVWTVVFLGVGLCVFAGLLALQIRAILRSPYPRLTAITTLAFSLPLFVVIFAAVYYLMERTTPSAFTQSMSRLDSLYYTVTVFTTVGFGDIAPRSEMARALTMSQMLLDLLLIGAVARLLLGAVQTRLASRPEVSTTPPDRAEVGGG